MDGEGTKVSCFCLDVAGYSVIWSNQPVSGMESPSMPYLPLLQPVGASGTFLGCLVPEGRREPLSTQNLAGPVALGLREGEAAFVFPVSCLL